MRSDIESADEEQAIEEAEEASDAFMSVRRRPWPRVSKPATEEEEEDKSRDFNREINAAAAAASLKAERVKNQGPSN